MNVMSEKSIVAEPAKLRCRIEEFLHELQLPPLTNDEWGRILSSYPKRYWTLIAALIREIREEREFSVGEAVMSGDLRDDLAQLLRMAGLSPLTSDEWLDILVAYSDHYLKLVNALIGEVRGVQDCQAVTAAVARDQARDEQFGQLSWNITRKHVKRFCRENEEVLSEEEMQDLYQLLRDFDECDLIAEAMDHMRSRS
jgi:hypothetical protein